MNFLHVIFRGLWRRPVRTGLTVLGVLAYFRWHDGLRIHLERAPLRLRSSTVKAA